MCTVWWWSELLGIEDKIPERAQIIRVLMMELNRITSHLGGIAPMGLELGATTIYTQGARLRERGLDLLELVTGLRMNHAFIRPGGVAQDLPPGALEAIRAFLDTTPELVHDLRTLIDANPIFIGRNKGIAYLDLAACMALGVTGPMLQVDRAALGPAQVPAVLRLRDLRLRRAGGGHVRRVRPVPDQDGRGRAVAADRPAVRRPAGRARVARPGQGPGHDQGR